MKLVTSSLSNEEQTLRTAIDFVPQGLAIFDRQLRLTISNARYCELLNLPENLVFSGTALLDIAYHLAQRGDFGEGDADGLARARVAELTHSETSVSQRLVGTGQVLEFHSSRLPDGGLV